MAAKAREYGITFPLAELGNCANFSECQDYCENPQNHEACVEFAKKKGFHQEGATVSHEASDVPELTAQEKQSMLERAKGELGCSSFEECRSFCESSEENMQKCMEFGRKHTPASHREKYDQHLQMLEQAKADFGCNSISSCEAFCNNPQNAEKCMNFAKKHAPPGVRKQIEEADRMMQKAKQSLGCQNFQECANFCQNPQNAEKCARFAEEQAPPEIRERIKQERERMLQQIQQSGADLPCNSIESCKAYCEKPENKEQCKVFSEGGTTQIQIHKEENYTCSTEEECRRWCEQNPDKCPGFKQSDDFKRFEQTKEEELRRMEELKRQYESSGGPAYTPHPAYTPAPNQNYSDYQQETTTESSSQKEPGSFSSEGYTQDLQAYCSEKGGTWDASSSTCRF